MVITGEGGTLFHVDATEIGLLRAAFLDLAAGQRSKVLRQAVNRTGDMAYTRVVAVLTKETGAANREVRKEVTKHPARGDDPTYEIKANGGYWPLKRFRAKQGAKGVSASPWNVKRMFGSTFIGPGGHVFRRVGPDRLPIKKLWGPAIPKEMVRGATKAEVEQLVTTVLPARILHETDREIGRVAAKYGF